MFFTTNCNSLIIYHLANINIIDFLLNENYLFIHRQMQYKVNYRVVAHWPTEFSKESNVAKKIIKKK